MRLLVVTIAALLLLPSATAAKSGIVLDSTPQGYTVGEPWVVSIIVIRHDAKVVLPATAKLAITIRKQHTGEVHTFPARRQRDGNHVAHVLFPSTGGWTYNVLGIRKLGRGDGFEPVTILPAVSASTSVSRVAGNGGSGFPVGWIAAASPIIIALGLFMQRRRVGRRGLRRTRARQESRRSGPRCS